MTDTFNFTVDAGTTGQITFRTRTAQFGDGYSQTVADGINNKVSKWTVSITDVYSEELASVIAFLDSQQGYKSFYWTPPDGVQGLYKCATYTSTPAVANLRSFTAEFQQVFSP